MLQLGISVWGIFILIKQKVTLTKNKVVTGGPAIAIGILFAGMLPLGFLVGVILGLIVAPMGQGAIDNLMSYAFVLDLVILALVLIIGFVIASIYGKSPGEIAREKRNSQPPYSQPNQQAWPVDTSNPYAAPQQQNRDDF